MPPTTPIKEAQTLSYTKISDGTVSNRAAWIAAFALGLPAGFILSFSGFGIIFIGVIVGVLIGAVEAYAANSYKILFGLIGNLVAIATTLTCASIRLIGAGNPIESEELLMGILLMLLVIVCPGFFASAIMRRVSTTEA